MILKGASGAAAEVPVHLVSPSNPRNPITGHTWTTGEVKTWWPVNSAMTNENVAQMVEKGFGDYADQGTAAQTAVAGCVYIYAQDTTDDPSGLQPYRGVEFITDTLDPAIREIPFDLMSATDPNGPDALSAELNSHAFAAGEVKLYFAGSGGYVDVSSQAVFRGHGMYAVPLTPTQRLNVDKVFISAQVSGAIPFTAEYDMVLATYVVTPPIPLPPTPLPIPLPTIETGLAAGQVDHVAVGLSRLCEQFKGKPKIAALVAARGYRWNQIENVLWTLLTTNNLANGRGWMLDNIGRKVGLPRNGLDDDDYQRLLGVQVLVNRSNGKHEQLLKIARLVLNNPAATIALTPEGPATHVCRIFGIALDSDTAGLLAQMLDEAQVDGVRLLTEYSTVAPSSTFRFDTGPGFDVGHFANAIEGAG